MMGRQSFFPPAEDKKKQDVRSQKIGFERLFYATFSLRSFQRSRIRRFNASVLHNECKVRNGKLVLSVENDNQCDKQKTESIVRANLAWAHCFLHFWVTISDAGVPVCSMAVNSKTWGMNSWAFNKNFSVPDCYCLFAQMKQVDLGME